MKQYIFLLCLLLLTGIVPCTSQAQNTISKTGFFKSMSLDPLVTLMNRTNKPIECIVINYNIDSRKMPAFKYQGHLPPNTRVEVKLPRFQVSDGLHSFDGAVSGTTGQSLKNVITFEGLSFKLSPGVVNSGSVRQSSGGTDSVTVNKHCACQDVKGFDISFWFSVYIDDSEKLDAFASIDKGKLWYRGKWKVIAGLENESNDAEFTIPSSPGKTYGLTVSTVPVVQTVFQQSNDAGRATAGNDMPGQISCLAYPNPFSKTVSIQYTVLEPALVDLFITDGLGRMIAQPVRGVKHGAGKFTLLYDGALLSAGTYFAKLKIGNEERTMKIIKQ